MTKLETSSRQEITKIEYKLDIGSNGNLIPTSTFKLLDILCMKCSTIDSQTQGRNISGHLQR